jgi:hypothetical protein
LTIFNIIIRNYFRSQEYVLPDIVKVKYQVYTGVAVVVVRAVVVVVDAVVVVFGVVVVTLSSFNRSSRNSDVS